ncbi:putative ribonuclease H-like domain-containing protein [Tanacetum coccineum]
MLLDVDAEAGIYNLETTMNVSHIPTTRTDKDHPKDQIIGDLNSAIQKRIMTKISNEHAIVIQALADPSWVEAMQEELLQFKLQKVWTLVDLPNGKRAIGTKWVFRNKKDERGIVIRNKARLVAQAPIAWYETLSTYLIENGFRRGTIDKTLFIKKDKDDILLVQVYVDDIVAITTIEAEYVAATNCCGQVLWIQNQMLDYGFNFMNTKIYIDNESIICIVKNPVFHSKTKHIEISHHFIRDSCEKKLIQVIKIHTDHNVADLLIKAFDVSSGPIHLVANETVYKEWEDRMETVATTTSSLEAEQDSGNINRTQSMATLNEPSPLEHGSRYWLPRCQEPYWWSRSSM